MMNICEYVDLILKKKKMTRTEFTKRINEVESKLGDSRTTITNVTNYLNGYHSIGRKAAARWEIALDLEEGTLIRMVSDPSSSVGERDFNEYMKKLREIRRNI